MNNKNNTIVITAVLAILTGAGSPLQAQVAKAASASSPNAPLLNAATVKEFVKALPDWGTVNPIDKAKRRDTTAHAKGAPVGATRTHHDIYSDPQEVISGVAIDKLWLGAIVQNRGLSSLGTMDLVRVPATKRAPFFIVATDLPGAKSVEVNAPSQREVSDDIDAMRDAAGRSGRARPSYQNLDVVENFNAQQTATDLSLDASYLGSSVQAALSVAHSRTQHTVTAAFIERGFTVTTDFEGRSAHKAFFNDNFTVNSARKLVPEYISMDNPPAYVKSITYGRMLIFSLTSTASAQSMEGSLKADVVTPTGAGGGGGIGHKDASQAATYHLKVTQFGGPAKAFSQAIPDPSAVQADAGGDGGTFSNLGDAMTTMRNYLAVEATADTLTPITYKLSSLKDDKLAAVPVTYSYNVDTYANNPTGALYEVKLWLTIEKGGIVSTTNDVTGQASIKGTPYWAVSEDLPIRNVHENDVVPISEDSDPSHRTKDFVFEAKYNAQKKLTNDPIEVNVTVQTLSNKITTDSICQAHFIIADLAKWASDTKSQPKEYHTTLYQHVLFTQVEQIKTTLHCQVIKVNDVM